MSQAKIIFELPPNWMTSVETMYADALGEGRFRLDNVPVFTPFISVGDVFAARAAEEDGKRLHFDRVLQRSKNVVHRLWLFDLDAADVREIARRKEALEDLEMSTDRSASYKELVVTFSVSAKLSRIEKTVLSSKLKDGERDGWWRWDVSSCPQFPT